MWALTSPYSPQFRAGRFVLLCSYLAFLFDQLWHSKQEWESLFRIATSRPCALLFYSLHLLEFLHQKKLFIPFQRRHKYYRFCVWHVCSWFLVQYSSFRKRGMYFWQIDFYADPWWLSRHSPLISPPAHLEIALLMYKHIYTSTSAYSHFNSIFRKW